MLQLSEQDKQEIIRHIESNQALPEKYRFVLFDDKREVELVWNGKSNEVCNIVLPFQVIEQIDESRAEVAAATAIQMRLFAVDTRGRQLKGWTNKLIWGDNKLILSSLNCTLVSQLEGGVYLNLGSAVILPEIFLKALTVVRNQGYEVRNFTTANFDFIRQYRPSTNVVHRPTLEGGKGFHFTGHHELMIPLLAAALVERLSETKP